MKIGRDPILTNPKFISVLPASWGTLHKLAGLGEEALEEMLADGTITADTRSADVDEIRKKMRDGGIYLWGDLLEALETLIKFRAKWPDPAKIVKHVSASYVEEGEQRLAWLLYPPGSPHYQALARSVSNKRNESGS